MAQLTSTTIYGNLQVNLDTLIQGLLVLTDTTASTSKTTGAVKIAGGLGVAGDIWATKYNDLTLTKQATGFTIAGGTTSRTLTVTGDTTISGGSHSGTNTGNQTITSGNGMNFTTGSGNVTITLGGPSNITSSSTNSVTTTSHTHAIVGEALTKTDDTNVTLTLGGTPETGLVKATSLTLGWVGQLSLTRGGSNASLTAAAGGIVYSTSTAMAIKAAGTAGQALLSGGTAAPTWTTGTLTLSKNLTISTGNVTLTGQSTGSSVTLPASGTLVPDSRKVAGMTLSNDIALKTLTISSPLSGASYDGSTAVSIGLASGYGDTQNPYASKTAKYFLAAPNGAAGAPVFRAIVASDIPTLNQSTTGNAKTATTADKVANTLTLGVSGTGLSGSATFNGSSAATFTVTSNATSSNTGSTIVARDSSGNFSAGTINGIISTSVAAGSSKNLLYSSMADSDSFRLQVGGASNAGYVEIATADEGTEPIYVRQYTGAFTTVTRTATLLDGSGNTTFPGIVTASSFVGSISATSHTHSTYDRASTALSGANVFSAITVADGIVTGTATRALTYGEVGAAASDHTHGNIKNDGKIGTTANLVVVTGTDGAVTTTTRSGIDTRSSFPPSSHDHLYAGSSSAGGAADSTKAAVTFSNGGSGDASGATFDGSTARTISYNTIGAAASSHPHGSLTNDGKVGTTTDQVVVTGTGGAITTASRSGIDSRSSFPPILDKVYPVGAVYLSVVATSPASLFGGTWTQLAAGYALWTATSGADSTIAAGLPNITGYMYANWLGSTSNRVGAFGNETGGAVAHSNAGQGGNEVSGASNGYAAAQAGWTFDAARVNSIYGASTTVQPPAYKVYAWKRVA